MGSRPFFFLDDTSLHKLRTAIFKVVWSRRQPLANVVAVLSLPGVYRLLGCVAEGCPGHGPVHLLVDSAAEIGLQWSTGQFGWERPGLQLGWRYPAKVCSAGGLKE